MADLQAIGEQPGLIHPDIISEIPWVDTVDMYDGIIGPTPICKEEMPPLYAEGATKAHIHHSAGKRIYIGKKWLLWTKMMKYLTRGNH